MPRILKRLKSECLCCGATENLTCDHIYPKDLGGISHRYNYMVLCKPCNNVTKGNKHPLKWLSSLQNPSKVLEEIVFFSVKLHDNIASGKIQKKYNKLGEEILPDIEHINCPNCGKDYKIPSYFKTPIKPCCNHCSPKKNFSKVA